MFWSRPALLVLLLMFLAMVTAVNRSVAETSLEVFVDQAVGRGLSGMTFILRRERE
jgi:hypothetical protein